jgi:RNA polymerase sigma factor (sigma-70 family)
MKKTIELKGQNCLKQVLSGNQEAFREFIKLYEKLVFSIAGKLVDNADDLNDLCQDIFIKVYQSLNQFRNDCKISTWIGKIAYHSCLNYLRKKKSLTPDCMNEYMLNRQTSQPAPPDRLAETGDISLRLKQEIDRMPVQFRIVLTLYHLEDLKYHEIAEIMALPEGTVKSYLFRARQLLKKRLLEKYEREELII